jgi:hypothetical protein
MTMPTSAGMNSMSWERMKRPAASAAPAARKNRARQRSRPSTYSHADHTKRHPVTGSGYSRPVCTE